MEAVVLAGAPVELLERESGLAFLARSLEEVRDEGHGRVALVTGEAGVGKTALLRRFSALETRRSVWGGCDPLITPRPLGPLFDVAPQIEGLELILQGEATPHDVVAILSRFFADQPGQVLVIEDV